MKTLTRKQAKVLCDMWDVELLLEDQTEHELLEKQNADLLEAYKALLAIAES